GELYGRCRSTAWHHIHSALQMLHEEMEVLFHEES
ncbi:MAG: sigma-70 family RNA polymerase sigma factor, partial [Lachnospiraceae bacterium]|nr:sigma-70 family RNA polymerase sigma factor [Lachnospiraceae bacterium]